MRFLTAIGVVAMCLAGCSSADHFGKAPSLTPVSQSAEQQAMMTQPMQQTTHVARNTDQASLWSRNRKSLLGDRRAMQRGDILTVLIELDDNASIDNKTDRGRTGSQSV